MVEYNVKHYLEIIVGIAILSFIICLCPFGLSIKESISWSISVITLLSFLFISFAWKWKIFKKWLVPFPNLNGQWQGCIESSYENFSKKIPVELIIKQSFLHIQIKLITEESKSNSIAAAFNIDKNRDIMQLCYTYKNEPKAKLQEKSPIHYGSVLFDIESDKKMNGMYWTGRETKGDISVTRIKIDKKR